MSMQKSMKLTGKHSGLGHSMKKAGSLLESDYISQLNKEKEELNAEIALDNKNKKAHVDAANLHKSETLKQRGKRQREYLEYLADSKKEKMKRLLMELIDNIHAGE